MGICLCIEDFVLCPDAVWVINSGSSDECDGGDDDDNDGKRRAQTLSTIVRMPCLISAFQFCSEEEASAAAPFGFGTAAICRRRRGAIGG